MLIINIALTKLPHHYFVSYISYLLCMLYYTIRSVVLCHAVACLRAVKNKTVFNEHSQTVNNMLGVIITFISLLFTKLDFSTFYIIKFKAKPNTLMTSCSGSHFILFSKIICLIKMFAISITFSNTRHKNELRQIPWLLKRASFNQPPQ